MTVLRVFSAEAGATLVSVGAVCQCTSIAAVPALADEVARLGILDIRLVWLCTCSLDIRSQVSLHEGGAAGTPAESELTLLSPIDGIITQN